MGIKTRLGIATFALAASALATVGVTAAEHGTTQPLDPGIVRQADGSLRDCTVTDRYGRRADWHRVCDDYWRARLASGPYAYDQGQYVGGFN